MLRCGKTAQTAIAAVSALAERYDGGKTVLSSLDIAKDRNLPQPIVAKLLNALSTSGLVAGTRGPGGGYWLAKSPSRISLADVTAVFEKENEGIMCPMGPEWCGKGEHCPLHEELAAMNRHWDTFMRKTTLAVFLDQK